MLRLARPIAATFVAVGLVTAMAVTSAGAGSKRPTPKQWAKTVCSSIETWINDVEDTLSSIGDEATLRDAVGTATDGIQQATDDLVTSLDDLGLPQTKNAKQARKAIEKLGNQLDNDVQRVEKILDGTSDDPVDIASTFADIGTQIQKAVDQVSAAADTLRGLDRNGDLQKALKTSPACKSLKNTI